MGNARQSGRTRARIRRIGGHLGADRTDARGGPPGVRDRPRRLRLHPARGALFDPSPHHATAGLHRGDAPDPAGPGRPLQRRGSRRGSRAPGTRPGRCGDVPRRRRVAAVGHQSPALDPTGVQQWRRPFQVAGAEPTIWQVLATGIPALTTTQLGRLAALPAVPKAVVFGADDPEYTPGAAARTASLIGAPAPTLIPSARHLTPVS